MALRLFEGVGVELEYMIVHADSLDVLPVVDHVSTRSPATTSPRSSAARSRGRTSSSTTSSSSRPTVPRRTLPGLDEIFADDVRRNERDAQAARRPPDADGRAPVDGPRARDRALAARECEVYDAFDRIFGCKGHGWSNLQCVHLNLPFHGDAEFARLHAAIRLVLPIIPALAASSPILDGRLTGLMDSRMHFYRENQKKIPSITGYVIPEPVYTKREYEEKILGPMYADIAPHDPDGILQDEWLNARGAIARFDRNAIEIRIIDVQECPTADIALAHAITCVLRALVSERWQPLERQKRFDTEPLNSILLATTLDAEDARSMTSTI